MKVRPALLIVWGLLPGDRPDCAPALEQALERLARLGLGLGVEWETGVRRMTGPEKPQVTRALQKVLEIWVLPKIDRHS